MSRVCKIMLIGSILSLSLLTRAAVDESYLLECKIKAAFLLKFAGYIEWPLDMSHRADAPFVIGVIGADEVNSALHTLNESRPANARPIKIRQFATDDIIDEVQILFIGRHAQDHLPGLLASTRAKPVLTVTESQGALEAGSIINFVQVGEYVRFDISMKSAEAGNIKLSSRLLNVARSIQAEQP